MKRTFLIPLFLLVFALPARALDLFGGSVVGKMGDVEVTASQLRDLINAQTPEVRKAVLGNPATLRDLVYAELLRRLMIAEAKKDGWDKRPDVALTMDRARDQAMIDSYMADRAQPDAAYPDEREVVAAYEANRSQFRVSPQLHLAQILLRVPERASKEEADKIAVLAREIFIKLGKGGKFADFVVLYSQDDATKGKAGDLGWLSQDTLLPQIRAEVSTLKPGDYTRPVRTQFGWQIIKLIETKPEGLHALPEVRSVIVKALRDARAEENRRKVIESLKARNPVSIDEKTISDIGK